MDQPGRTQRGRVDTSPLEQTPLGAGGDQGQQEEPKQASLQHEGGRLFCNFRWLLQTIHLQIV